MVDWLAISRCSSSILFPRDGSFATERLGSGGLFGALFSLTKTPDLQPCFCLRSLLHLQRLPLGEAIHGDAGALAIPGGMLCECWKTLVIGALHVLPINIHYSLLPTLNYTIIYYTKDKAQILSIKYD